MSKNKFLTGPTFPPALTRLKTGPNLDTQSGHLYYVKLGHLKIGAVRDFNRLGQADH